MKTKEIREILEKDPDAEFYYGKAGALNSLASFRASWGVDLVSLKFEQKHWSEKEELKRARKISLTEYSHWQKANHGNVLATKEAGELIIKGFEKELHLEEMRIRAKEEQAEQEHADYIRRINECVVRAGFPDLDLGLSIDHHGKASTWHVSRLVFLLESICGDQE